MVLGIDQRFVHAFPQLWVGGELVGGSDIMAEMAADGSLQALIKEAVEKAAANKTEA